MTLNAIMRKQYGHERREHIPRHGLECLYAETIWLRNEASVIPVKVPNVIRGHDVLLYCETK